MYIKKLPNRKEKLEIIKNTYLDNNLEIIGNFDNVGNLAKHKVETKCLVCQHIWNICPDKVRFGRNCPRCARKRTGEINRQLLLRKSIENYVKYGNFKEYKKHVRLYTFQSIKQYNLFLDIKIGKGISANHVDHIRSKWDCFKDRIPPYIAGSVINLQTLSGTDNLKKGSNSWQTKQILIEKYDEWISKNSEYADLVNNLPCFKFNE